MLLFTSFFAPLYEFAIGPNRDYAEYRSGIFGTVGLMTLLLALGACALFYAAMGRWKPLFHRPVHWWITLVLMAILGFAFAYTQARGTLDTADAYTARFALFNAFYACLCFFLISLLLKRTSIFAKHTPF